MSLFSGMKIKQPSDGNAEKSSKQTESKVLVSHQQQCEPQCTCVDPSSSSEDDPLSQFDFIKESEMEQITSQSCPITTTASVNDRSQYDATNGLSTEAAKDYKWYTGPAKDKMTSYIISDGHALVGQVKQTLCIESLDDQDQDPSVELLDGKDPDTQDILFNKKVVGMTIDVQTQKEDLRKSSLPDEESKLSPLDNDGQLQYNLDLSSEERFEILQKGHLRRTKAISAKKELLRSEVIKITTGRIQDIFSVTCTQKKLQDLQTEQHQAIAAEDYERAESLSTQCLALESELNILPDMSLSTHFVMEELLQSALELQNKEYASRQKMIQEISLLKDVELGLSEKYKVRLSEIEVADKQDVQRRRKELEKEQSHFMEDGKKLKLQETELEQKISERTQDHEKRKSELEIERDKIKIEIEVQYQKLQVVEKSISIEDEHIYNAIKEFESEVADLDKERMNNLSRDDKLKEVEREVTSLEETQKQELHVYIEWKERHEKLVTDVGTLLKSEQLLFEEVPVEDTWAIQIPPSLNSTQELINARIKVKEHDEKIRRVRADLVQGQKKMVSLKTQVSDFEGLIAELEQSKKLAVEVKQFSEAKTLSEEIQEITNEGKGIQFELEELMEKNQHNLTKSQEMQTHGEKLNKDEEEEKNKWEEQLKDKLIRHFRDLYEDKEKAIVKHNCAVALILLSELQTSSLLLNHLCQKLNFSLPTEVAEKIEEVLKGIETDTDITESVKTEENSPMTDDNSEFSVGSNN